MGITGHTVLHALHIELLCKSNFECSCLLCNFPREYIVFHHVGIDSQVLNKHKWNELKSSRQLYHQKVSKPSLLYWDIVMRNRKIVWKVAWIKHYLRLKLCFWRYLDPSYFRIHQMYSLNVCKNQNISILCVINLLEESCVCFIVLILCFPLIVPLHGDAIYRCSSLRATPE